MARAGTQTTHDEPMIHYSHRDSLVRDSRRLVHPFTKVTKRQGIIHYLHASLHDLFLVHTHNTYRGNDSFFHVLLHETSRVSNEGVSVTVMLLLWSNNMTKHNVLLWRPYSWFVMTCATTHNKHNETKILYSHRDTLVRDSWWLVQPYTKVMTKQSIRYYFIALVRDLWWRVQRHTPNISRQRFITVTVTPSFVTRDNSSRLTQK